MLHYTLNSADTFDCRNKNFDYRMIDEIFSPIATRAIAEGQTRAPLPSPFEDYNVKITAANGAAFFDLYLGEILININGVAWSQEGQKAIWPDLESFYLKFCGQSRLLSVSRAPVCPDSLPWLATLILLAPEALGLSWLADFEQCLALALIRYGSTRPAGSAKPKRNPPKGFGGSSR